MSRCFPFPPPGYIPSRASNEALIESIKLQKGREKVKSERRKEKKEKKREKKDKKKSKEETAKQIKASQLDHNNSAFKGEFTQKEKKDDTEQLERSSITEEHEQPSQIPSYSSDSTQNSGCKRKRHALPVNSTRVQGGNILRFRLPSQKQIKHDVDVRVEEQPISLSSQKLIKQDIRGGEELPVLRLASQNQSQFESRGVEDQPSTSGRTEVLVEDYGRITRPYLDKSYPGSLAAELKVNDVPLRSDHMIQPNSAEQQDNSHVDEVYFASGSRRFKKMKKVADKYKNLIENWTPPSMLRDDDDNKGDDDWLIGSRNEATTRPVKMLNAASTDLMICYGSSTLWPPRAHHIPGADIYALPYTIPF